MAPDVLREVVARATAAATAVAEFAREMAFELRTESQEALRTGFGVPRAVSSAASLGCFAVAAAGTASLTLDFVKKFYGARECEGCSGWEALTCCQCLGTGKSAGGTATGGEAAPCAACAGTGVAKCGRCNGNAWKPKLTMDRILDSPVAGWEAYRQCQPVTGDTHQRAVLALVEQGVAALPVPPRPAEWADPTVTVHLEHEVMASLATPVPGRGRGREAAASAEEAAHRARVVQEAVMDAAWAAAWRKEQVAEVISEMNEGLAKVRKQSRQKPAAASGAAAAQPGAQTPSSSAPGKAKQKA